LIYVVTPSPRQKLNMADILDIATKSAKYSAMYGWLFSDTLRSGAVSLVTNNYGVAGTFAALVLSGAILSEAYSYVKDSNLVRALQLGSGVSAIVCGTYVAMLDALMASTKRARNTNKDLKAMLKIIQTYESKIFGLLSCSSFTDSFEKEIRQQRALINTQLQLLDEIQSGVNVIKSLK
jgi:hypothetical protein